MCETHNRQQCGCRGNCLGPRLWSKKKKVRMLEKALEHLKEKEEDIREALDELKS